MPLGVYARPARAGSAGRRLWQTTLLALRPAQLPIDTRERVRVVLGACLANCASATTIWTPCRRATTRWSTAKAMWSAS
jgi:hypothetical protein